MSTPESPSPDGAAAPAVSLRAVTKRFGDVQAVAGVDLEIADGEFFSLLGPSGSGKTTVLRMIAGFERPTSGRIELGGVDVTERPPFDRDVNTVFQDYALFPHMSVVDNVAYGLRVRGTGKAQRRKTADEALAAVALEGYADRRPSQLSGGQRQRVALARALVNRPRVLLLDEPLGALDLKLRQRMQVELKAIQREAGITFVFVTHDQEEALTMSDRIAVFNGGLIEQVGTGADLYERPATPFVAGFVGTTNLVEGNKAERLFGAAGTWSLRPEHIDVQPITADAPEPSRAHTSRGTVREALYLGTSTRLVVDTDGDVELLADVPNLVGSPAAPSWVGRPVALEWSETNARKVSA